MNECRFRMNQGVIYKYKGLAVYNELWGKWLSGGFRDNRRQTYSKTCTLYLFHLLSLTVPPFYKFTTASGEDSANTCLLSTPNRTRVITGAS